MSYLEMTIVLTIWHQTRHIQVSGYRRVIKKINPSAAKLTLIRVK